MKYSRRCLFEKAKTGHTYTMEKLRKAYAYVKEKYKILSLKRYTTLAGTLVFFLITSIVPFAFWLALFVGKLPLDVSEVLQLPVFESVKNVLAYVQREAVNATASASLVLVVTTLYSSTNLFYQMRRSGEIIYEYRRPKKSLRVRLGAVALTFIVMGMIILFLFLFGLGSFLFSRYLTGVWKRVLDYALLLALAFALAVLLNAYICPYKTNIKQFLPGALATVLAWTVAVVGFTVYLKLSNMDKLYGALSAIIVFLLWLYVLMICFIAGVIFNSERIVSARKVLNAKHRAERKILRSTRVAHKKA